MSLNKAFSTVLEDYNEEAILASGDEQYVNLTTAANIRDVCEKTDTMSLRDAVPASETEDVHMTSVSSLHNRQITPPRTFQDTSSDTLPLHVTSQNKQTNPTIPPPPPKDSLHNNKRTPRASSTDSSSSASSHSSRHRRSRSMHVPRDAHKRKHHSSHRHSKHHKHSRHSTPRHSPSPPPRRHSPPPPPPRRHSPPPTVPRRSNTSRHNSISRHTSDSANKHPHHASSRRDTSRQTTPEIRDDNTRRPRVQRCFNCGRPGHMKKDCRQPRRRLKTAQNQKPQCFVFKAPITNLHIHK